MYCNIFNDVKLLTKDRDCFKECSANQLSHNNIGCWLEKFNQLRAYHFDQLINSFDKLNFNNNLCQVELKTFYDYHCKLLKRFDSDSIIELCLCGINETEMICENFENAMRMIIEINSNLDIRKSKVKAQCLEIMQIGAALNATQDFIGKNFSKFRIDENRYVHNYNKTLNPEELAGFKQNIKSRNTRFSEENETLKPYFDAFLIDYKKKFGYKFSRVSDLLNVLEKSFSTGILILPPSNDEYEYFKILQPFCMTGTNVYRTYKIINDRIEYEDHKVLPYVYEKRLESTYVTPFILLSDGCLAISYKMFRQFWTALGVYDSFNRFDEFRPFVKARHDSKSKVFARDMLKKIEKKYKIIESNLEFSVDNIKGEIDCIFIDANKVLHLIEFKFFEKGFSPFQIYTTETSNVPEFKKQIERYYLFSESVKFQNMMNANNAAEFCVDFVSFTPLFFYLGNDISIKENFNVFWYKNYCIKYDLD